MRAYPPKGSLALILLGTAVLVSHGHAQNPPDTHPGSGIQRQKIVEAGGRSIILNVISPPSFLPARPAAVEEASTVTELTEEQLAALQATAQKPQTSFIIQGTTYANGITEFTWNTDNANYRAYSNARLGITGPIINLETEDSVFQLTLLISPSASQPPAGSPAPTEFSQELAQYLVVTDPEGPAPQETAFTAIDALHEYYDANKQTLLAAHAAAEAAQAARELELQNNPPQPQDVTISFFPKTGSAFLQESSNP